YASSRPCRPAPRNTTASLGGRRSRSGPLAWALEETVTARAGALCFNRSRSRLVSMNGARWLRRRCAPARRRRHGGCSSTPDVIDQHLDPRKALEAWPASRRTSTWAGRSATDTSTGGAELTGCVQGASRVPATDRQVHTHPGQAQGGRRADTAADQHGPASHRSAVELSHDRAPWPARWRRLRRL